MGIRSIFSARVLVGSNSGPGGIFYKLFLEINHEYSQTKFQKIKIRIFLSKIKSKKSIFTSLVLIK